jgi:hypothetical protein
MASEPVDYHARLEGAKRTLRAINGKPYKGAINSMPPRQSPILSKPDVLATRSQRATSILDNFALLQAILDRHEGTIRRRWLDNKKPKQRLELIRKAWGTEMPSFHRPDFFQGPSKGDEWQQDTMTKEQEAYMCPYINEEDLLKPRNLLWFMVSRGRHHPSSFAATDYQAMHAVLTAQAAIYRGDLPDHVMMFTGRKDYTSYGECLNIHEHPDAGTWLAMGQGPPVSDGLLILEAQQRIMLFLVACVQSILHDVECLSQGPKRSVPMLSGETSTGFASLATTVARAPYLPPAQLDFDRIVSLLTTSRDSAANHLWSLREDPGYYRDYVLELKEHRFEMIKPVSQNVDPMNPKHEVTLWTTTLRENFSIDHLQYEIFSELHSQALCLRQMSQSHDSVIQPEHILPEPYLQAILRFRYYLNEAFMVTTQYKLPFAGSPPWRNLYYREIIDEATGACALLDKRDYRLNAAQRRLGFILGKLTTYRDRSSANEEHTDTGTRCMRAIGITKIVDCLQHCVESEPDAKAMLTPYIASSIGTLATISECLHQLELYQPWASTFDSMLTPDRLHGLRSDYAERSLQVLKRVGTALQSYNLDPRWGQLARLGAPTRGRFSYPIWRRKNEETVKALRTAESDLDAFWNGLDKVILEKLSEMGESHLQDWLKEPRDLQRTAPWVEPLTSKVPSAAVSLHRSVQELDLTRQ